jgi:hypothetical protein
MSTPSKEAIEAARTILQGHGTAYSVQEVATIIQAALDKATEPLADLLALAQQQQEDLVTPLKKIRTLTEDVEIRAIIDAAFINLK